MYGKALTHRRDAQFELIDALLLDGPFHSFVEITLSPSFRRGWRGAYDALAKGGQDREWLHSFLVSQLPPDEILVFALDTTTLPQRPDSAFARARPVSAPATAASAPPIHRSHVYSLLACVPWPRTSWVLPISTQRVPRHRSAIGVGIHQVQWLFREMACRRPDCFPVVVANAGYGSHHFLGPLQRRSSAGALVRLRRDRTLYGGPRFSRGGGAGGPGSPFAFRRPETWGKLEQAAYLLHEQRVRTETRVWHGLRARQVPGVPLTIIRVQAHHRWREPRGPLWLAWLGPYQQDPSHYLRWYEHRWPVEPAIRYRKQRLCWTLPLLREPTSCDRWTLLVDLAQWMLCLARGAVRNKPQPWQSPQAALTPQRVRQSWKGIVAHVGTPARPPGGMASPWSA